ncbi:MAG: hypothetical protein FJX76_29360 [Armatimonadetes bacterium]|nr:hypothetical protein [Armatimonadota bacterium]
MTRYLLCAVLLFGMMAPSAAQWYNPKDGEPPPAQHQHFTDNVWQVNVTPDGEKIKGTVTLACYKENRDEVIFRLTGTGNERMYTFWLLRKDGESFERAKMFRAWDGDRKTHFYTKSEHDGKLHYRGCLTACPLGFWKWVEVRYHPDGNPNDLQTSVVVIKNKLVAN